MRRASASLFARLTPPRPGLIALLLLVLHATALPLIPCTAHAAPSGDAVRIHQRVGLASGASQGVPVTERITLTIAGGYTVSGDTVYAPMGAAIQVGAASQPGGCEAFIQWQAPGGSPQFGSGASFRTFYTTPGVRVIKAICGTQVDSMKVVAYKVTATEIAFDWQAGDAQDASDIRANRTTDVLKPEWRPGARNEPVAWIMNRQPVVRAKFTVEPALITRLTISSNAPAPWQGFNSRVVNFVAGTSAPDTLSFRLLGSTPSAVSRDTIAVNWFSEDPNGMATDPVQFGTSGPHPMYTLYRTPQAPMAEPWTEVLWYACNFARGASTETGIVDSLTWNVYFDSNLIYNPSYYYSSGYAGMNLSQFLYDMAHSPFVYLDCRDCSHWAHLQSNALGMNGMYNTLGPGVFLTNYVKDMGRDYWHQWNFNFHQVGWFWGSMVADMAAAGDGDGTPWSPPHTELISRGQVTLPQYLDVFTEVSWVHSIGTGICSPF